MKRYVFLIGLIILGTLTAYFYPEYKDKVIDLNPNIYINTTNDISDDYINSNIDIVRNNQKTSYNNALIKLRGNTSRYAPKHPYTLKFREKVELIESVNSRKWALIANYYDNTLVHNKLVYDFSSSINLPHSVKSRYFNVYLNNNYIGNYLLVDKIHIYDNDYLLEYENSRQESDGNYIITNKYNWRFLIHEGNDITELLDFFDKLELTIESQNYYAMKKIIDINSLVDAYIIEEYFKDADCDFSSLYFYIKDNKLYAGPSWDFDLALGFKSNNSSYHEYNNRNGQGNNSGHSYEGIYCNKNIYGQLLKTKVFKRKVISRYKKLQPMITRLYEDDNLKISTIEQYYEFYKNSFEKDICKWKKDNCATNYLKNELKELKKWLKLRNEWLLKEYKIVYNQ